MEAARTVEFRRFTGAELDRMVEVGIISEDEPLELLEGVLETVSPQSATHAWLLDVLEEGLRDAYGPSCIVRRQTPIDATEDSRPEPDLAVIVGPRDRYRSRHPAGPDTVFVVEIACSGLDRDHRKARIYARAGVPVYWIVDVDARRLEVHQQPGPDGYAVVSLLGEHQNARPPGTDLSWRVSDLLP